MHLGIIVKISSQQNTTNQMFEFVQRILWTILTLLWQSGASESATVSMFSY